MKAIVQKDLRENFKVALIGLVIFSLLLIQAYQSCLSTLFTLLNRYSSVMVSSLQPLLSQSLLAETAFFCAIFGAGLGWLQTCNEAHRDLWAFLIHRPISRTNIIQGKCIAGLCLYGFGAGLPLLALVAVVRTPGHIPAPFQWAMVLPLLAIFLAGVAFYFAGLLTGLRQARWFGSRCFGLGWAVLSMIAAFGVHEFWQSLMLTMTAVAILAAAVWGSYQSGGFYKGQPMLGRLAQIIVMAAGSSVALLVAVGLTMLLIVQPFAPRDSYSYDYYQMTKEGKIYKVTMQNNEMKSIVDLDGHPVLDPKTNRPMTRQDFQKIAALSTSVESTLNSSNLYDYSYLKVMRFFNLWRVVDKKLWYVDNHGQLIGYDGVTRKFLGALEPRAEDGAVMNEEFLPPSNRYDYYYSGSYNDSKAQILVTARTVYQIDLKDRTVKPIFSVAKDDEIGGFADAGFAEQILITTRNTIRMLTAAGDSVWELPYKPDYAQYPRVMVSYLNTNGTLAETDKFTAWLYPDYQLNQKAGWKMPEKIYYITAGKQVSGNFELPVLRQPPGRESWPDRLSKVLVPPVLVISQEKHFWKLEPLMSCALDLICVAIGWQLGRRYNFSTGALAGWVAFIVLLGIPGLLTLLCIQEWPAREQCPRCQKFRTVDRESCEHCEAGFSAPERNGTEIFEPLVKA